MRATADLRNKTWTLDTTSIQKRDLSLELSFFTNGNIVEFKDLSFGVVISRGDTIGLEEDFPKNGMVYLATDQEWLEIVRIFVDKEDQDYELKLWARNDGEYFEQTFTIYSEPTSDLPPAYGGTGTPIRDWSSEEEYLEWQVNWQAAIDKLTDGSI